MARTKRAKSSAARKGSAKARAKGRTKSRAKSASGSRARRKAAPKTVGRRTTSARGSPRGSPAGGSRSSSTKTGRTKSAQSGRKWSAQVNRQSDSLDLESGVFRKSNPRQIASSLKRSAERSRRKKGTPYQSAMSMLNFYINRGGKNLSGTQKRKLERAKGALREMFGRA